MNHKWLVSWLRIATLCLAINVFIVSSASSAGISGWQTFDSIYDVVPNPAGIRLAVGGTNGLLKIIDAETLADILIFPVVPGPVYGISWSPDGARMISSHYEDNAVRVWNAINGQLIRRIGLLNAFGAVLTAWSSDGTYIAVRQDVAETSEISIYNGTTYDLICNVKPIRPLGTLAWHAGSNVLLVGSNNGSSVIDMSANCAQSPVPHRTESLTAISTAPIGNQVALGTGAGSVIIADETSLQALNTFQISSDVIYSIGWSADGATLRVASQDKMIRIIDASDGSTLVSYPFTQIGGIGSTALSPDGTRVIFGDGTVIRSEPITPPPTGPTGSVIASVPLQARLADGQVFTAILSRLGQPSLQRVLTANDDNVIILTDVPYGSYTLWVKHPQQLAQSLAFTLDAPTLGVTFPNFLSGDANNDNVVNISDFSIMGASFGLTIGQPGYDPRPDFNASDMGFANLSWINIFDCTTPGIADARNPGDARYNFMTSLIMPTLATRIATVTPTP